MSPLRSRMVVALGEPRRRKSEAQGGVGHRALDRNEVQNSSSDQALLKHLLPSVADDHARPPLVQCLT